MPKTTLPRITSVEAGPPYSLEIAWATGERSSLDISGHFEAFRLYGPLREDPALFAAVAVGEYGTHVAWTDNIDMAAVTLWRLAQEQSGATTSATKFCS